MTWRDVYLGGDPAPEALREHLASAFGLARDRVSVVGDVAAVRRGGGAHDLVAASYSFPGEYPRMLSLYVFLAPREVEALDEASVLQALADGLGAPVLLPAGDPDPFAFARFRPLLGTDAVVADPTALDERGEMRITRVG